ncbi:MAG: tRNA 2-selenouridine(34) synthase MnmH [Betaproteobacteria bacterium]|nr:tRNA 2-selenouridine(34) synthase MnmH [Betaproteobacteria bacterium]
MDAAPRHSVEMLGGILTEFDAVIDTRSPSEYAQDHVPDAVSCPVLDDGEREQVGTLYKQVSSFDARKAGAALVARNIARHVEQRFAGKPKTWHPLVYCWRGGKRSGAMVHVLREIGWDAKQLDGGYKAYRRFVVQQLSEMPARFRFRVLCGATGSGKSRLLRALADAGAQVLDLEDLAAHRGSVLGALPERPQPAQKMFETLVWQHLSRFDPAKTVYVEGESRKIGQLQVPESLINAMRASDCVLIDADVATRVALLLDEYSHYPTDRSALAAQLDCLVDLHGRGRIAEWKALAGNGEWGKFVERLLVEHYDPAYRRSSLANYAKLHEAARLRVEAPGEAEFARLARTLVAGEDTLAA